MNPFFWLNLPDRSLNQSGQPVTFQGPFCRQLAYRIAGKWRDWAAGSVMSGSCDQGLRGMV